MCLVKKVQTLSGVFLLMLSFSGHMVPLATYSSVGTVHWRGRFDQIHCLFFCFVIKEQDFRFLLPQSPYIFCCVQSRRCAVGKYRQHFRWANYFGRTFGKCKFGGMFILRTCCWDLSVYIRVWKLFTYLNMMVCQKIHSSTDTLDRKSVQTCVYAYIRLQAQIWYPFILYICIKASPVCTNIRLNAILVESPGILYGGLRLFCSRGVALFFVLCIFWLC